MELAGKNVVVAGLAASGLAVAEFLTARGARVVAVDVKPLAELKGVAETLERLGVPFAPQSAEAFAGADAIVISPGVPADIDELQQARRRGIPVLGEVELAGWFLEGNTIGITGANGKTTTTALAGHILEQAGVPVQVGGNIGKPVTAMVGSSRPDQWNVLELSSFQLETIKRFRAHIGVCVNVTPDHLDRHHTFENYAAAKGRLFETQQAGDFAVLNADDRTCTGYASRTRATPVWFSFVRAGEPGMYADARQVFYDGKPFLAVAEIPLRGRHNVENVMAAAAAAHLAGVSLEAIAAGVKSFPGVEHRIEFVRKLDGVDFYNDSKATNVDATQKAIDAFPGGLWIILGGKDKGSDYTVLREPLRQKAKAVLLVGAAAPKIKAHLGDAVRLIEAGTIAEAVRSAWREAAAGDTILLAPACASFDQFTGYEQRGRVFKELVRGLESRG
ncbi:MAG TPA: UDP-N-acetylmuramoyl-L-alanine--D-glutamate ligase [Bryobacteraceae bacterium]|nr:UDP-N-acetylmuramoyl-L-alanine--D-glutamate ligase [Bryobacteraceae bacterium]